MANASVIPGDLQRENTEDVLQGERLSEADNCAPIPTQPALGADVWEDVEHSRDRNLNHVQPLIRKVWFRWNYDVIDMLAICNSFLIVCGEFKKTYSTTSIVLIRNI